MKKIVSLIIVIAVLGGMFYINDFHNKQESNKYYEISKEYNEKLRLLRKERESLTKELEELENTVIVHNMASTIMLISDTKRECLDDAVRIINENGYKGVIVLKEEYLPDNAYDGYLNRYEINNLIYRGYEVVIGIGKEDSPIEKLKLFNSLGYRIKGFYIEDNLSQDIIDEMDSIENMVIIGNIENNDKYNSIVIPRAGLCSNNVKNRFIDSVNYSSILAISVGYNNKDDLFGEKVFNSMIDTIKPYVQEDQVHVTNITETISRYKDCIEQAGSKGIQIVERKQEITNRLKEIENELRGN